MRPSSALLVLTLALAVPPVRSAATAPAVRDESSATFGALAWRAGDVIESARRLSNDLEVTCLVGGKLTQRFVRSEESEARTRTRVGAVRDGRIERVGVRYDVLVERTMVPAESKPGVEDPAAIAPDALEETPGALAGHAVELALDPSGPVARREDGAPLDRGTTQTVFDRELSRAQDLDTGLRALDRWLSGRRLEVGVPVAVPDLVSLELLRGETPYQASVLVLALVAPQAGDPSNAARLRLAWHLAWTADEPGQELAADLAGHVLVDRASARVLRFDASGPVDVAGAAQAGETLVEYAGRGRMQLTETREFAREP